MFTHLFDLRRIDNPRSQESGILPTGEHELLDSDWLVMEQPDTCLAARGFEELAGHGDFWNDDYKSLKNLVHQLHSLAEVTEAALAWRPDVVVFCRPDLRYMDSLRPWLKRSVGETDHVAWIPNWQHWGGFNDRFAICSTAHAASVYGTRVEVAAEYTRATRRPLHGERLLAWALRHGAVAIRNMPVRAVRVRVGGNEVRERFLPGWTDVPVEWFWQGVRSAKRLLR